MSDADMRVEEQGIEWAQSLRFREMLRRCRMITYPDIDEPTDVPRHPEIRIQRECPCDHICTCFEFMGEKWKCPSRPTQRDRIIPA